MDASEVYSITKNQAQTILKDASPEDLDILDEIEQTMTSWGYTSDTDLDAINQDIIRMIQHIAKKYFKNNNDFKKIHKSLHCIIFDFLNDQLMPLIKITYKKEDMEFYEKCTYIRSLKINPSSPSTKGYESLPFTSAVVELSMLDIHLSPLEKINCFCTTYDLIFAELKSSLISLASKYSDKEIVVPVVNNEEVISILVYVLTRSQLLYFLSSLHFVRQFAQEFLEKNTHLSDILKNYEIASKHLIKLSDEDLSRCHKRLTCELNATDVIKKLNMDIENKNIPSSLQDEYENRYISLITRCTEKDFIPTNI